MALAFYYTAGASLGGAISGNLVSEGMGATLPNISLADATNGITNYRCICIRNVGASIINNAGVYFASDISGAQNTIALGITGKNSGSEQTVGSIVTAPVGNYIYQKPSFDYAPMRVGLLNPGDFFHLWLKSVIPAYSPGDPNAYLILAGVES
jgi:hypothetical protein